MAEGPPLHVEPPEKFSPTMHLTGYEKPTRAPMNRLKICARRITTIAGDVSADGLGLTAEDRNIFSTADTVIHSAATVSFDSPLDQAVEINLLGPVRIAELCNELGITPHIVAVSTCYVAGNRRGTAPEELVSEGPFAIGLDWRSEVASARRLKGDTEAASRQPDRLIEFRNELAASSSGRGSSTRCKNRTIT